MKCLYYLTSTLKSTQQISEDLHEAGINDWFIHVISKNESGLKNEKLHSGNFIEKLDILRDGILGALIGFIVGILVSVLVMITEPFGSEVKPIIYFGIVILITCFGAWSGGLTGVASENRKMVAFHDDIEAGKYLILIYASKGKEAIIDEMMKKKHPEANLSAVDVNFFNPMTSLKRVG
ncbi:hypothetical protein L0152_22765 [bacterium]|nr:hypothetical protein [bacterium]